MSLFDPTKLAEVAHHCSNPGAVEHPEAWYRTTLNRAYLSALLALIVRIENEVPGAQFREHGRHGQVRAAVKRHAPRPGGTGWQLRDQFRNLGDARADADYFADWECRADDAELAVERQQRILGLIGRLTVADLESLAAHL